MFYTLEGKEPVLCTAEEFERLYEDGNRRVSEDRIASGKIVISTVFVGVNTALQGNPPLLFESMVTVDGEQREFNRYATWEEAENGHQVLLAKYI